MFAIVEACGRQYKLEPGRFIDIDRQELEEGAEFVFDKVLMIVDGESSTVGKPYVDGATVKGKVISRLQENPENGKVQSSVRSKKVIVYKMQPKKGVRIKKGHRQQFLRVMVDSIELNGKGVASKKAEKTEKAKPAKAAKKEEPKEKKSA